MPPKGSTIYRPSKCDPHADTILGMYAGGCSVRTIAKRLKLSKSTVGDWIAGGCGEEFAGRLARARKANARTQIEDAVELVDAADPEGKSGSARVAKAREQANLRKYIAACLDRETWGERVGVDMNAQVQIGTSFATTLPGHVIEAIAREASPPERSETDPPALGAGDDDESDGSQDA